MPGRVQDLLVKVQTVDADFVLFPLAPGAHLPRLQHRLRLDDVPGGLQRDVLLAVAVEHAEEVVVAAGHDRAVVAVPAALELVEDAVVLVQRAQLRAEVLVHRVRLDRLRLHVQIPHLNTQIVAGNHVPAGVAKLHVTDRADNLAEEALVRDVHILRLLKQLRVPITEGRRPHIT